MKVQAARGPELLVVAGEASGDRIASLVVRELAVRGTRAFGLGGPACRRAGVATLGDPLPAAAMGFGATARRLTTLGPLLARLVARVARSPPRAAFLVNFTELNARLGRLLRTRGVRVLWCVAPQVWAWRPGRLRTLRGAADRLAVILPFEEPLWREAGFDAHYVGHPSVEVPAPPRAELREKLGIDGARRAVAVLPGSRAGEIARLAGPLCEAAARLRDAGTIAEARLLCAPSLDPRVREHVEACSRRTGVALVAADPEHGAAPLLGAFDVALCASGTASLEAALAGAAPVVAYRMGPLSFAVARRLVRIPHIALPNVLLGRRAFPELVQEEVTAERLAAAAIGLLDRRQEAAALSAELRSILAPPSALPFGRRVADLLEPLLA